MASTKEHLAKQLTKTVSVAKGKKTGKSKVHHFTVTPAENGHVVETHMNGENSDMYRGETKTSVHKTMASVKSRMQSQCDCPNCAGGGEKDEEE